MNVFIAGGSGTIGVPLAHALVAAGHRVTVLTRSRDKAEALRAQGMSVAIADALDAAALDAAVREAMPTHVVHELTALPKDAPKRASDLEATNRLRVEGTRNLLGAAIRAGARRFIVGSFAPLAPRGGYEGGTFSSAENAGAREKDAAAAAIASMEEQVLAATSRGEIEGVILRYGLFYGPDVPSSVAMLDLIRRRRLPIVRGDASLLPLIHIEDAVAATIRALEAAPAGGVYDVVDDRAVSMTEFVTAIAAASGAPPPRTVPAWLPKLLAPYVARMTSLHLPLSNAAAKQALGWRPRFRDFRDALGTLSRRAA